MARTLDAMITDAAARAGSSKRTSDSRPLQPVRPKKKRRQKVGISTWLSGQECATLDDLCARCHMSRAAMILALHQFMREKNRDKRLVRIERTLDRIRKTGGENNGDEK